MGFKDSRVLCDIRGMKLLVRRYCQDESARVWFESREVHYDTSAIQHFQITLSLSDVNCRDLRGQDWWSTEHHPVVGLHYTTIENRELVVCARSSISYSLADCQIAHARLNSSKTKNLEAVSCLCP